MADAIEGVGIGLRGPHVAALADGVDGIDWLELLVDNHLGPTHRGPLAALRVRYPMAFHAVGMNLGGPDPLDLDYIRSIAALADDIEPEIISDHVAFTAVGGHHLHDLLPLPFTEEAAEHLARRIARVQDVLGRRILIENASRYLAFEHETLSEADFLGHVATRADCHLLLDLNNAYVSQRNLGAPALLDALPLDRVGQIHLAGHTDFGDHVIDSHAHPVAEPVWALFDSLQHRCPGIPTLIEWDEGLPAVDVLVGEARKAAKIMAGAQRAA